MFFNQKFLGAWKVTSISSRLTALVSASAFVASCVPTPQGADGSYSKKGSHLSQIQMRMPATDGLTTADGKKPITGIRVTITPVNQSACANGTKVDQVLSTTSTSSVQQKIAKGCDYDVRVELGKFETAGFNLSALSEVYYAPTNPTRITSEMTKDDKISVRVSLALTDEGRRIGLPENLPVPTPNPVEPQPQPQPPQPQPQPQPPQPQPQPQPQPPQLTNLPAKLNVSMTSKSGPTSLPAVFTTPYLVLDFARPGCPPCVALANKLNTDSTFQRLVGGSKCRAATIIPPNQLSDWIDGTGGPNSHSGNSSYEYEKSHSGFASLFGTSISATPTYMIVDRTGAVIEKSVGGTPSKLQSICGG